MTEGWHCQLLSLFKRKVQSVTGSSLNYDLFWELLLRCTWE